MKERIYLIIRRLADGLLPRSVRDRVLYWLGGEEDAAEKDDALFRVWNETEGEEISAEEVRMALYSVKRKLGMLPARNSVSWGYRAMKYAAVILLPLLTALVVWSVMDRRMEATSDMMECFVPQGQQREIELPDGTHVVLNSGTLFIYPKAFYGEERGVYLSGEAYFRVTHDKENPFIVHTGKLNVKVLGTCFNVEAYPEERDITTTLEEGQVKVYCSDQEDKGIVMRPDDRLVYHRDSEAFELFRVNADDFSSWKEGEIRLVQRPLSEVIKVLERHYNVTFRCDGSINMDELYTVRFRSDETIEDAIHILSLLAGNTIHGSVDGSIVFLQSKEKGGGPAQ